MISSDDAGLGIVDSHPVGKSMREDSRMRFFACSFVGVLILAGAGLGAAEGVELHMLCQEGDVIDGTRVRSIMYFDSLNNRDDVAFYGLCGSSGVLHFLKT